MVDETVKRLRGIAVIFVLMIGILFVAERVEAQDAVITDEPTIQIDDPGSDLPDWSQDSTVFQAWQAATGAIVVGVTAFLLRYVPMPADPQKREDRRKGVAFSVCVGATLIGSYINGSLGELQPTLTAFIGILFVSWALYEKIPTVKKTVTTTLEGRPATG